MKHSRRRSNFETRSCARRAVERMRVVRPTSTRALEQADTDEHMLKDLVRKLAQFKSSLESQTDAEQLIATSQAEIEHTRKQARADLEEVTKEVDDARRDLRTALDQYRQLRRELDRLQPELSVQFAEEDHLLWDAEGHFPGGQLQLLGHEVDASLTAFAGLSKLEQYARLKVWIGRFRLYQAAHERDTELNEEHQALGHRVFHQLKWLSRQYEPGYIEAFRQDYTTDWAAYVTEAREQLAQAIESSRRNRDAESVRAGSEIVSSCLQVPPAPFLPTYRYRILCIRLIRTTGEPSNASSKRKTRATDLRAMAMICQTRNCDCTQFSSVIGQLAPERLDWRRERMSNAVYKCMAFWGE